MEKLAKLLAFLDGKKSIILAIAGPVLAYLVKINAIDVDLGLLLSTILSVLAGGAKVVTADMALGGKNRLGLRK